MRRAIPILFFAVATVCFGQGGASPSSRSAEVESSLLPPVVITNHPASPLQLSDEMKKYHVPAVSIAVLRAGRLDWAKAYGVLDPKGKPASVDSLFQAASISKSLTATAAVKLVEQGKLSLDAPIESELKSWKLPGSPFAAVRPVTLRELLSHTAGINVHGFTGYAAGEPVPTLLQVLNGAKPANSEPIAIVAVPGQDFSYSGGGYVVIQQAMVDATGLPFPVLMQTLVLDPLNMSKSTYEQPLTRSRYASVALPADESGQFVTGGPYTYPEMAPAGLWTNPTDLAKWIVAVQEGMRGKAPAEFSSAQFQLMLTPAKEDYGLGVELKKTGDRVSFSHDGANQGYRAIYVAYLDGDGVVIMTSGEGGMPLIQEILRSVAHIYGWPDYQPVQRTSIDLPAVEESKYTGKFSAKDAFDFKLSVGGDQLQMTAMGRTTPLLPSSPSTFFSVAGVLQMTFETRDRGYLLFGTQKVPFSRIP